MDLEEQEKFFSNRKFGEFKYVMKLHLHQKEKKQELALRIYALGGVKLNILTFRE